MILPTAMLNGMDLDPIKSLSAQDTELYNRASDLLRVRGLKGQHSVAAAVRTVAGSIYASLDLLSRKTAICGEPGAISAAHSAGDYNLESIIAVCFSHDHSRIISISPCGSCRELINYHQPDCRVLFEYDNVMVETKASELFRFPSIQSRALPSFRARETCEKGR
jgi:cytidine deaminase